jgi:hypothetical protein
MGPLDGAGNTHRPRAAAGPTVVRTARRRLAERQRGSSTLNHPDSISNRLRVARHFHVQIGSRNMTNVPSANSTESGDGTSAVSGQ